MSPFRLTDTPTCSFLQDEHTSLASFEGDACSLVASCPPQDSEETARHASHGHLPLQSQGGGWPTSVVFLRIARFPQQQPSGKFERWGFLLTGPGGYSACLIEREREPGPGVLLAVGSLMGDPGFSSDTPFNDEFIAEEQELKRPNGQLSQPQVRTDPICNVFSRDLRLWRGCLYEVYVQAGNQSWRQKHALQKRKNIWSGFILSCVKVFYYFFFSFSVPFPSHLAGV